MLNKNGIDELERIVITFLQQLPTYELLTSQEFKLYSLKILGYSKSEIQDLFKIKKKTLENHLNSIKLKAGYKNIDWNTLSSKHLQLLMFVFLRHNALTKEIVYNQEITVDLDDLYEEIVIKCD